MNRTTLFSILAIAAFALVAFTYRNEGISRAQCRVIQGTVKSISACEDHVVIALEGKRGSFYLADALQKKADLQSLEKELIAADVTIWYADTWTPFTDDPRQAFELQSGNTLVYTEFNP